MSSSRTPAIGIDLGTTFSVVAMLDDTGRPQTLTNAEGDNVTPSVVLFDGDDVVVGKEAVKAMSGEMAQIADCCKRELGQRVYHKTLNGRQFPPEAIQAWVLNKLRQDAQMQVGDFEKVVITVPAYFDEVRRKATQDAGYMAGFEVMDIINEPTAAAVAYGFQQGYLKNVHQAGSHKNGPNGEDERRNILVYDLGGGTFDVTVMEIGGSTFTALATDGDVQLGGRDFDQRLVDFVAEEFLSKFKADPRTEINTLGRLLRECEDAKRTLSARSKTNITCDFQGRSLKVEVTREKFHQLSRDLLDRTAFTTRHTLAAAGLEWDDIDRVLMVGGSTRIPFVCEMLKELSGKNPDRSISPDEAVAHGAALHAGLLISRFEGRAPNFQIENVNSHSLGVVATDLNTRRKRNAILIPRNTKLPTSARRVFKTHKPSQKSILVQIVEGESASPDDCAQIGKCSVRNLPPELPAQTPIELKFHYEENGRLTVKVKVTGAKASVEHEIMRENSLNQRQLDSWRKYISRLEPSIVECESVEEDEDLQIAQDDLQITKEMESPYADW